MWLFRRFGKRSASNDKPGEDEIGQYALAGIIGHGSFGVVKSARHKTSKDEVAIKIVSNPEGADKEKLLNEIAIQRRMDHPNVVKILDVIERENVHYIVMELVSGGDLFDYIVNSHPRLVETEARRVFQQIVAAIRHCHGRGIVHRDLKPENIFVDAKRDIKLGDFGFSTEWRAGQILTDSCGSPNYAAPELLYKGCEYEGPEIDIWSLGVILYALLCSCLPFDAQSIPELFRLIKSCRYSVPGFVSPDAKALIGTMIVVDPVRRAHLQDIWDHPWFQKDLPVELADKKKIPLPSLLEQLNAKIFDQPAVIRPLSSRWSGVSKSDYALETLVPIKQGGMPQQRHATSAGLIDLLTSMPEKSQKGALQDIQDSASRIQHVSATSCTTAGYQYDLAVYTLVNQLVY
jgi:serine/threonine protein kinase